MRFQTRCLLLVLAIGGASGAFCADDPNELALRILANPAAAASLDPGWMIDNPELAVAWAHLSRFKDAGPQTLEFKPAAPAGLSVIARSVEGTPNHWIVSNASAQAYSGSVAFPSDKKEAVAYMPVWASNGSAFLPQRSQSGQTSVNLTVPARGLVALRPAVALALKGGVQAEITRIEDSGARLEIEFQLPPNAAAAMTNGKATVYLPGRARLTHIHHNGKGAVSFAPLTGADIIRPIPFKLENMQARNVLTVEYRPWLWINIAPERLKAFPFYKASDGQAAPCAWICVDDQASESDKKIARQLASALAGLTGFAGPASSAEPQISRPVLPVTTRAQADGEGGAPEGGPNRVCIGPRDSLLFPAFAFQPEEKRHVYEGGGLACLAEDPDGYQVIYITGKTDEDRAWVVRGLIHVVRAQGIIP